jgi:CheY-like chemotaxis protein
MSKTILVVDDEPDVVTYLRTVLKDAGYDTLEAACTCLDRVDSKNSPSVMPRPRFRTSLRLRPG